MANLKIVVSAIPKGLGYVVGKFKSMAGSIKSAMAWSGFHLPNAKDILHGLGSMIDKLDGIADASKRMGVDAESFQKLAYAAKQSGASAESVETAFKKMAVVITDAANGSKASIDTLKQLGLTVDQLKGKKPEEQFAMIADEMAKVTDHTTKAALAQDIFGRGNTALIPMIDSYRQLSDEIQRMNGIISNETVDAANRASDAIEKLKVRGFAGLGKSGIVEGIDAWLAGINRRMDILDKQAEGGGRGTKIMGQLLKVATPITGYISAIMNNPTIDDRSPDQIKKDLAAFKAAKATRLAGAPSATPPPGSSAASVAAAMVRGDSLQAIGANAPSSAGSLSVVSKLDRQTQVLENIENLLRPSYVGRPQKSLTSTVKDGAK